MKSRQLIDNFKTFYHKSNSTEKYFSKRNSGSSLKTRMQLKDSIAGETNSSYGLDMLNQTSYMSGSFKTTTHTKTF